MVLEWRSVVRKHVRFHQEGRCEQEARAHRELHPPALHPQPGQCHQWQPQHAAEEEKEQAFALRRVSCAKAEEGMLASVNLQLLDLIIADGGVPVRQHGPRTLPDEGRLDVAYVDS